MRILKPVLITSVIMLVLIGSILFFMLRADQSASKNETGQAEEGKANEYSSFISQNAVELTTEGSKKNLLIFSHTIDSIYDISTSAGINNRIQKIKEKGKFDFDRPLFIYNPYGTNEGSLYMYFQTNDQVSIQYTITVADQSIPDFTRVLDTNNDDKVARIHENQLIGLVPGMENFIVCKAYDKDGKYLDQRVFKYTMGPAASGANVKINEQPGNSADSIKNGLFFTFQTGMNDILLYDNAGVLRGQIPVKEATAGNKVICSEPDLYYRINSTTITKVTDLGQVVSNYSFNNNLVDFTYDTYGHLLAVAKVDTGKKVRDEILSCDVNNGKINTIKVFSRQLDLNCISMSGTSDILLGSGKTSSILKMNHITSVRPKIQYVIGEASNWNGSSLAKKILPKAQEFPLQTGINSIEKTEFSGAGEGQYYISLLNNNLAGDKSQSKYYKYLIDEKANTVQLVSSFDYPFTSTDGSVQNYNGHTIICSKDQNVFAEYDMNNNMVKQFSLGIPAARVFKEDMMNIWFQ